MPRSVFIIVLSLLMLSCAQKSQPYPQETGPIEITSSHLKQLDDALDQGEFNNLHSVLISQNDSLIYKRYLPGQDYTWGNKDLGRVLYNDTTLHDVRSISKSVVSACIGIALEEGIIDSLEQKVFDFFPEYAHYKDHLKEEINLRHLLSMSDGLRWDESGTPIEGSEIEMENSLNPVEFILSQPMEVSPGLKWNYKGGATELLAQVLQKNSGLTIYEFAQRYLFEPLEIKKHEWITYGPSGIYAAPSGLRLSSPDLLKFGQLYLNGGKWKGTQVLSEEWVEASLKTTIYKEEFKEIKAGYGYQFWTWEHPREDDSVYLAVAHGLGDQKIYIDQENELLVVVTAGNYFDSDLMFQSMGILDILYADIQPKQ